MDTLKLIKALHNPGKIYFLSSYLFHPLILLFISTSASGVIPWPGFHHVYTFDPATYPEVFNFLTSIEEFLRAQLSVQCCSFYHTTHKSDFVSSPSIE